MKYLKNLAVIVFVALGMLYASNIYANETCCAQGKECTVYQGKHKGPGENRQKMWDKLNLTAEQKKQLEANKEKNRAGMKDTFEKMKACRESLKKELMKPELDMNKINGIQSQIKSLQSQMVDNRLNSVLEVRKIMTHEQFEKFLSLTGEYKGWHNKGDRSARKCN